MKLKSNCKPSSIGKESSCHERVGSQNAPRSARKTNELGLQDRYQSQSQRESSQRNRGDSGVKNQKSTELKDESSPRREVGEWKTKITKVFTNQQS